ncbi:vascular endothelial growth factor A, long form isoform 1-T1 [Guaruba guarouba]
MLCRPGLTPCLQGAEVRPPLLPSQDRITSTLAAELLELGCSLLGLVLGSASGQSSFLCLGRAPPLRSPLVSQRAPVLVAWSGCLRSLWLRDAFTKLSVPAPHALSLPRCPSDLEGQQICLCWQQPCWRWSLLSLLALAWPWAGSLWCWQERRRAGGCVCKVEIYASALGPAVQTCPMCFPLPARHMAVFFFLLFLAFSSVFSLSPFLSFSLSFSVFLFCFSSRKSKRGKGKGQKRKRKKGRYKPLSFHCEPCSERRKHLFVQDPQTCKCSCKFTDSRCKSRQLELNERTCRCEKPRR